MQNKFRRLALGGAMLAMVGMTGCATVNDVVAAKEAGREGTTKEYKVSEDQAWDIARTVFRWEGADAIEEHRKEGYMLTSTGMSVFTYGSVMGAWVAPGAGAGMTKVTVVTKRRMQTNLVTSLTESTFHNRFQQGLDIVNSGKPLPRTKPDAPATK